jgi:aspartate 1-decarboxylase
MDEAEAKSHQPRVLLVDGVNRPLAPNLRIMETGKEP